MEHNFHCEHKRIILRPLVETDIEWVRHLRNQPQIRCWFNYAEELTEDQQRMWFEKYRKDPTDFMYVASLRTAPNIPIGTYADYNYDHKKKTIEAGRLMVDSQKVKERGLGYDIVGAAVKIAFSNLNIDDVTAEIFSDNERSLKCTIGGGGFRVVSQTPLDGGRHMCHLRVTRDEYEAFFQSCT